MKEALLRNMNFFSCTFLLFSAKSITFNSLPKKQSLFSLAASTRSQLKFYSSEFHSTKDDGDDDVSKNELKLRIQKFFDGDEDAIPSIFEGILKRKLSGKHEESDDELMKEIRSDRHQPLDDVLDQEFNSESSDFSDTDGD